MIGGNDFECKKCGYEAELPYDPTKCPECDKPVGSKQSDLGSF